jgi:hypothetical protein
MLIITRCFSTAAGDKSGKWGKAYEHLFHKSPFLFTIGGKRKACGNPLRKTPQLFTSL